MIFALAGHTPKGLNQDPGAVGNGYREADLTMEFRDMLADRLRARALSVFEDDDTHRLSTVLGLIKSKETDIVCDIHFNAAGSSVSGVEVIVPDRSTDEERKMADEICKAFSSIMKINNRGVKSEKNTARKTIAVMRPAGINILIEICFISSVTDVRAYMANKERLADALCNIIEKYEKLFV